MMWKPSLTEKMLSGQEEFCRLRPKLQRDPCLLLQVIPARDGAHFAAVKLPGIGEKLKKDNFIEYVG